MRQSQLFTKTRKEAPKDEVSKNAQLLIKAGYIHKEMAGAYTYLPLGLRVLKNINGIIREEMDAIGGQELFMPSLQSPKLWQETNRWSDEEVDVWFKSELKAGGEVGLAWTHEEDITALMTQHVHSHKDLPLYAYHIQNKFRNEMRAKSGIMRTREFLMKDLYSFSRTEEEHTSFYEKCSDAYMRIFNRLGIGEKTFRTFASGGAFTKFSHEFQTISDAGEDTIYVSESKGIAVNDEVLEETDLSELGVSRGDLEKKTSIEVGNIFSLGAKFSEALGLSYKDEQGEKHPVIMGSYGIGPARSMGTIVETLSDEKGIVWPLSIAPFKVHLIDLSQGNEQVEAAADVLYKKLTDAGMEVLFDDRQMRAGEKFADSDLIGIPYRVIVSERNLSEGKLELVERASGETRLLGEQELLSFLEQ